MKTLIALALVIVASATFVYAKGFASIPSDIPNSIAPLGEILYESGSLQVTKLVDNDVACYVAQTSDPYSVAALSISCVR